MFWTRARNVSIFVLVACAASLALSTFAPRPVLDDYTNRLEAFESDPEGFDAIFIGSSRVMRGFVPELFDEVMGAGGQPVRSFNFGLPASGAHEWAELLPELLARSRRPLKWVLVELNPMDRLTVREPVTDRMTHWHTPRGTVQILESVAGDELTDEERRDQVLSHLRFGAIHSFNLGRGPEWLARVMGRAPELATIEGAGWVEFDPSDPNIRERREEFVESERAFTARLDRARRGQEPLPEVPMLPELVLDKQHAIEAAGARAVFVVMPPFSNSPSFDGESEVTLLEYNDAVAHPELFHFEAFHDRQHLSTAGARLFTRQLAEDLLKLGGAN